MTVDDLTNFPLFKTTLGYSEGGGNYKALYPSGSTPDTAKALGKYQFIPARITDVANFLNVPVPDPAEFINNKDEQEAFFIGHVNLILRDLDNDGLLDYVGTDVTGANKYPKTVPANIYGLIGGAHLGGVGGVQKFINNGTDAQDSLGTHISDYIAKFSDKVPFINQVLEKGNELLNDTLNDPSSSQSMFFFVIIGALIYFVYKRFK